MVKPYKIKKEDIESIARDYPKYIAEAGREGILYKLLPMVSEPENIAKEAGVKIAEIMHATPKIEKISKKASGYFALELRAENGKATFYLWAHKKKEAERIVHQYLKSYPAMEVEEETENFFFPIHPGDYLLVGKFKSKRPGYPLDIVHNGSAWRNIIAAMEQDEESQRAIIQILIIPKTDWVLGRTKNLRSSWRQSQSTDETFLSLKDQVSHMASQQPFIVEIRVACLGKDPTLLQRRFENIVGAFKVFRSQVGGNQLKPQALHTRHMRVLKAIEGRALRFTNPIDYMIVLTTQWLGHNFLALPTEPIEGLETLELARTEMPEEYVQLAESIEQLSTKEYELDEPLLHSTEESDEELFKRWAEQQEKEREKNEKITNLITQVEEQLWKKYEFESQKRAALLDQRIKELEKQFNVSIQTQAQNNPSVSLSQSTESIQPSASATYQIAPKVAEQVPAQKPCEYDRTHNLMLPGGENLRKYPRKERRLLKEVLELRKNKRRSTEALFDRGFYKLDYPKWEAEYLLKIAKLRGHTDILKETEKAWSARPYQARSKYYYRALKEKKKPYYERYEAYIKKGFIVVGEGHTRNGRYIPIAIPLLPIPEKTGPFFLGGATRMGKTSLLGTFLRQIVRLKDANIFILDPKGRLVYTELLPYLPESYRERIVIIDPTDLELPVGTNVGELPYREVLDREGRGDVIDHMIDVQTKNLIDALKRATKTSLTASTKTLDRHLGNLLRILTSVKGMTMQDLAILLQDKRARYRVAPLVPEESLKDYLLNQLPDPRSTYQQEQLLSTLNRLNEFQTSKMLKATLCKRDKPIKFEELVAPGKIVIFDLKKGRCSRGIAEMLGIMLLALAWSAALAKKVPGLSYEEGEQNPFPTFLVIDEFQNFATGEFQEVLSEGRDYWLLPILTTQYTTQVPEQMADGILGNVAVKIVMPTGGKDVQKMAEELTVKKAHFQKLAPFTFFINARTGTETPKTFWGRLFKPVAPAPGWEQRIKNIRNAVRERDGSPYDEGNTSLLRSDVQTTEDFLSAVYGLHVRSRRLPNPPKNFAFDEIIARMEAHAHLPGQFAKRSYQIYRIMKDSEELGYITVEIDEEIAKRLSKDEWYRACRCSITEDGVSKLFEKFKTHAASMGGAEHKELCMKTFDFFIERGEKLQILGPPGSKYVPDAKIHVVPTLVGRRETDAEKIRKLIADSWLHKLTGGKDAHIEVETETVGVKEQLIKNFIKAFAQDCVEIVCVKDKNDGYKVAAKLEGFIEEGYKDYIIDPAAGLREGYIPRKPDYKDFCILVISEPHLEYKRGKFVPIKETRPLSMSQEDFKIWRAVHEMFKDKIPKEGDKLQIGLSELYKTIQPTIGSASIADALQTLEKTINVIVQKPSTNIERFSVIIPKSVFKRIEATIEEEELEREEARRKEQAEKEKTQAALRALRKALENKNFVIYDDVVHLCRALNLTRELAETLIQAGYVELGEDRKLIAKAEKVPASLGSPEREIILKEEKELPDKERIYLTLKENPKITIGEISEKTDIKPSIVRARIAELIKEGKVGSKVIDKFGKKVYFVI